MSKKDSKKKQNGNGTLPITGDMDMIAVSRTSYTDLLRLFAEYNLKILTQARELSTLNRVVQGRKRAARTMRERMDAAVKLHRPDTGDGRVCVECLKDFPCATYLTLRPRREVQAHVS